MAYENDGVTVHRPGIVVNGYRVYDPFVGTYLSLDPLAPDTWSSYLYVDSNPVGRGDPSGLRYWGPNANPNPTGGCSLTSSGHLNTDDPGAGGKTNLGDLQTFTQNGFNCYSQGDPPQGPYGPGGGTAPVASQMYCEDSTTNEYCWLRRPKMVSRSSDVQIV